MQKCRVQVVNVNGILRDVVGKIVGCAVRVSGLDPRTGEPEGEATGVMIPSVVVPTGGTTGSAIESFFRNSGNYSAYRMIEFGDKTRRSFRRDDERVTAGDRG